MNNLYYGDNLDILRRYIESESINLIYLDPPFKSNQDYNILFAEKDGSQSASQILAFEDTWQWDQTAAASYHGTVEHGGSLSETLQGLHRILGTTDMLAYVSMMAPRLVELRRVLRSDGSIYLHCDPAASHYLKMLMDAVFGPSNFRNEIVWKRTSAHNDPRRWGRVHDILLFYTKTDAYTWNQLFLGYDEAYLETFLDSVDENGKRYKRCDLTGAGRTGGQSGRPWKGIDVSSKGRHWAVPGEMVERFIGTRTALTTQEKLDILDQNGRVHWPNKPGGMPRLKQYVEDLPGVPLQDVIADIRPLHNLAAERLRYPTQKPTALLDRIIRASSREGEIVLDPFCGCGTAIESAEKLRRQWSGIDITHLAITLIKTRLKDTFSGRIQYEVIGEPVSLPDAQALAQENRFQFQCWALGLVGARPSDPKRGADQGIDGRLLFHDEKPGATKQIVISVKSGGIPANHIRELRGVVDRESAAIGLLITLSKPTKPMLSEAASAGFYASPFGNTKHPRIQILTVEELLQGKQVDCPQTDANVTFKRARPARPSIQTPGRLFPL